MIPLDERERYPGEAGFKQAFHHYLIDLEHLVWRPRRGPVFAPECPSPSPNIHFARSMPDKPKLPLSSLDRSLSSERYVGGQEERSA